MAVYIKSTDGMLAVMSRVKSAPDPWSEAKAVLDEVRARNMAEGGDDDLFIAVIVMMFAGQLSLPVKGGFWK